MTKYNVPLCRSLACLLFPSALAAARSFTLSVLLTPASFILQHIYPSFPFHLVYQHDYNILTSSKYKYYVRQRTDVAAASIYTILNLVVGQYIQLISYLSDAK